LRANGSRYLRWGGVDFVWEQSALDSISGNCLSDKRPKILSVFMLINLPSDFANFYQILVNGFAKFSYFVSADQI